MATAHRSDASITGKRFVRKFSDGDIVLMRWRIGRKIGKNIYAMVGDEPSDEDIDIGRMDNESIAAIAVLNHNESIDSRRGTK